jgi:hypothetical protein
MHVNALKTEAELRHAVIDRLIAASLSDGKPAREATLARWRALSTQNSEPARTEPEAG